MAGASTEPLEPGGAARRLGPLAALALVVGHTIGVGIFLTPAELIGTVGSPAVTFGLWLGCGALVLAGAFVFGELASRYPHAGGPYVYLREAWGPRAAFLYGWQALLVTDPAVTAALALGLSQYLAAVWPEGGRHERWLALVAIWALALVAVAGLRLSARAMVLLTTVKVGALAAVVAYAFAHGTGSWGHFAASARPTSGPPTAQAIAAGLLAVFFSFGGFWEAGRVADVVRRPNRTLPLALGLGVLCVTAIYLATTAAFIYLVSPADATSGEAFARLAGEAMFGSGGPAILAAIVVCSVAASALGLIIMAPRVYVAMSADRAFPAALAAVNPATGSAVPATLLLAGLASLYTLVGTFRQIVAFFLCSTLAFVALAAAALVPLRARASTRDIFRAPGHPLTTLLFVGWLATVIVIVAIGQPLQALAGFAVVGLGAVVHRMTMTGAPPVPFSPGDRQ
jgi:APA family basic amino acid/polyamine antiporter